MAMALRECTYGCLPTLMLIPSPALLFHLSLFFPDSPYFAVS